MQKLKIMLLSSAYNGFSQRINRVLLRQGHSVGLSLFNKETIREQVEYAKPDLILCPFLKDKIPEEVYYKTKCLIVHPGVQGDRGPSSLDWAIEQQKDIWGVTVMEAHEEMDIGDVYATKTFSMPETTSKSALYNN